jgi:hypothetical protein
MLEGALTLLKKKVWRVPVTKRSVLIPRRFYYLEEDILGSIGFMGPKRGHTWVNSPSFMIDWMTRSPRVPQAM